MYYVTDLQGTPLLACWFSTPDEAEDAALRHGFEIFTICSDGHGDE